MQLGRNVSGVGYSTVAAIIPHRQIQPVDGPKMQMKKPKIIKKQLPLTLLLTKPGRRTKKVKLQFKEVFM